MLNTVIKSRNYYYNVMCSNRMDSFTLNNGKLYCIPHFKQLFITRGNYDEGFGVDPHKNKWATNSSNSTSPSPIAVSNGDLWFSKRLSHQSSPSFHRYWILVEFMNGSRGRFGNYPWKYIVGWISIAVEEIYLLYFDVSLVSSKLDPPMVGTRWWLR